MKFLVMIRRTESGYSADVPDLPGCVAAAKTLKAVKKLIAEAIELHLCTWVEVKVSQPV